MCFTSSINRVVPGSKSPCFVLLIAFVSFHPCCFLLLLSLCLLVWFCMVHIKHATRPISNKTLSERRNMASKDVMEVPSQRREGSVDTVSLSSHDDSPANTSNSDGESRSSGSNDMAFESDLSKRAKVAAARIAFDFGVSNMGRTRVAAMETHARYFLKDYCRSHDAEIIPIATPIT
jgi:hypothetical protein